MRGNKRHSIALGSVWVYRLLRGVKECCVLYILWAQLHLCGCLVQRQTYRTDLCKAVCTLVAWGAGMETAIELAMVLITHSKAGQKHCVIKNRLHFCRQVWTKGKKEQWDKKMKETMTGTSIKRWLFKVCIVRFNDSLTTKQADGKIKHASLECPPILKYCWEMGFISANWFNWLNNLPVLLSHHPWIVFT